MPIYVYRCQDCRQVHEILLRGSRPEPTICPSCEKGSLERMVAAHARPITSSPDTPAACDMPMCGMGGCGSGACAYPN